MYSGDFFIATIATLALLWVAGLAWLILTESIEAVFGPRVGIWLLGSLLFTAWVWVVTESPGFGWTIAALVAVGSFGAAREKTKK